MSNKIAKSRRSRKKTKPLKRKTATVTTKMRVLIVTEGEVTEVDYFREYVERKKFTSVEVDICGRECDSTPSSVAKYALKRAEQEGGPQAGGYDLIFCVFDRDEHADFDQAISKIVGASNSNIKYRGQEFAAIVSYPSFEYWLLLHFHYSRAPYSSNGSKSAGDGVTSALKKVDVFSRYSKSLSQEMLDALFEKQENAFRNAQRALRDAEETREMNPSTQVHLIVERLGELFLPPDA